MGKHKAAWSSRRARHSSSHTSLPRILTGLLPQAQMGVFLPRPLSTLVSLKHSLQSLTVTRKLLPTANLNPSPPAHSRLPALFWGRGSPLFAVRCGVKRADTASALSVAGSITSSPQEEISTSLAPRVQRVWWHLAAAPPCSPSVCLTSRSTRLLAPLSWLGQC